MGGGGIPFVLKLILSRRHCLSLQYGVYKKIEITSSFAT